MSGTAANVRSGKFEIVAEEIHQAGSRITAAATVFAFTVSDNSVFTIVPL